MGIGFLGAIAAITTRELAAMANSLFVLALGVVAGLQLRSCGNLGIPPSLHLLPDGLFTEAH